MAHSEGVGLETEAQKGCGMTSLRLFEIGGASIAEDATSRLFKTPLRYRRSRWPYDISVVLHAVALVSVVNFAWYLTPPPPPAPAPPIKNFTSAFILPTVAVDDSQRRRSSQNTAFQACSRGDRGQCRRMRPRPLLLGVRASRIRARSRSRSLRKALSIHPSQLATRPCRAVAAIRKRPVLEARQ